MLSELLNKTKQNKTNKKAHGRVKEIMFISYDSNPESTKQRVKEKQRNENTKLASINCKILESNVKQCHSKKSM
jgi:hypothetical protein